MSQPKVTSKDFEGTWKIVAGDMGLPPNKSYFAVIQRKNDVYCDLYGKVDDGAPQFYQSMRFNPDSGMLENLSEAGGRCIAFWRRSWSSPKHKNCIFAIRRKDGEYKAGEYKKTLLPWEENAGDNGSWGAEEGG